MKSNKLSLELRTSGNITCPLCKVSNKLVAWDAATHSACDSREKRRAYVSLEESKAYSKKTQTMYICPNCGTYVDGFRLKVSVGSDE